MHREIGINHGHRPELPGHTGRNFTVDHIEPHSNARLKTGIEEDLATMRAAIAHDAVRTPRLHVNTLRSFDADTQKYFERNQLEFLGSGVDHLVFELDEFPGEVVKVQARLLERLILTNSRQGLAPDHASEKQWQILKEFARRERLRYEQLVKYFGAAVPRERVFRRQVPVTKAVLEAAERDNAASALKHHVVYKLWTAVRLQEKLPQEAFKTDASFTLTTTYTEGKDRYAEGEYEALNEDLLDGEGVGAEEYLRRYPQMVKLLEHLNSSVELKQLIQDFVSRAVEYTTETGEILDMAGRSNLRVYLAGDKWQLIMPDPLFPDTKTWMEAEAILWSQERGQELHGDHLATLVNSMNYARLINALAVVSGSSARLKFAYKTANISAPLIKGLSELSPKFSLNQDYRSRSVPDKARNSQAAHSSHTDTWQTGLNKTYAA